MSTEFISEPIEPVTASADTSRMAAGEPGVPKEFLWRDKTYHVKGILKTRKKTGPCRHGSREQYVRRHYYTIETSEGDVMTIYFERQAARGKPKGARWWLFSKE